MTALERSSPDLVLGTAARRPLLIAAATGAGGVLLGLLLSWLADVPVDRIFRAYLVAFVLVLGICLWALLFTMIQHAVHAGWSVVVRRLFEVLAGNLRWMWVLFIPIAAGMWSSEDTHLYEWNVAAAVDHDPILQGKAGYLNALFWLARAAVFFAIWGSLAHFYLRESVAQDHDGDVEHTRRMERLAPVGILLWALSSTFAAFDWIMALEPHWFSTIFGVYFFAASSAAFASTLILMVYMLRRSGKLLSVITAEHYQEMGKLLFAFGVVFWAYIAYSQMMLIWYANIPEETNWYLIRSLAGWWPVSLMLLFGHFLVPFVLLISRHPKRRPEVIAVMAGWMLLMALVDFYWLVMPEVPARLLAGASDYRSFVDTLTSGMMSAEDLRSAGLDPAVQRSYREVYGFNPNLLDLAWVIGLAGFTAALTLRTMGRCALVPLQDPRLQESLAFENI